MEIMNTVDLLSRESRVVRLDESYGYEIHELFAEINSEAVTIHRIGSVKKPKQFYLAASELDALCEAWQTYKREREAAQAAEEERQNQVIALAYEIASQVSSVQIKESQAKRGQRVWTISIEPLRYDRAYSSADNLFSGLLDALKAWQAKILQKQETRAKFQHLHEMELDIWMREELQKATSFLDQYEQALEEIKRVLPLFPSQVRQDQDDDPFLPDFPDE